MDKNTRYQRIYNQVQDLFTSCDETLSRQASLISLLHHKMTGFFWTGFYLINDNDELCVGPYQGPIACLKLKKNTGVCWEGINKAETIIVPDVHKFPGHIACDSRSKSEIVTPLRDKENNIIGVLDIDSDKLDNFDQADKIWLEKLINLIY